MVVRCGAVVAMLLSNNWVRLVEADVALDLVEDGGALGCVAKADVALDLAEDGGALVFVWDGGALDILDLVEDASSSPSVTPLLSLGDGSLR